MDKIYFAIVFWKLLARYRAQNFFLICCNHPEWGRSFCWIKICISPGKATRFRCKVILHIAADDLHLRLILHIAADDLHLRLQAHCLLCSQDANRADLWNKGLQFQNLQIIMKVQRLERRVGVFYLLISCMLQGYLQVWQNLCKRHHIWL